MKQKDSKTRFSVGGVLVIARFSIMDAKAITEECLSRAISKQEMHMVWIQLFLFVAFHTIHRIDVAQFGLTISWKFPRVVELFRIVRFDGTWKGVRFAISKEKRNSYENIFLSRLSKHCLCCAINRKL